MDDNTAEFLVGATILMFIYFVGRLFTQYEIARMKYKKREKE